MTPDMKRTFQLAICTLMVCGITNLGYAQSANPNPSPGQTHPVQSVKVPTVYNNGAGFDILMNNSGFAFGGYYQKSLSQLNSFIFEAFIGSVKDSREQKFFNYFGGSFIPNKENYLLTVQTHFGLQRRLFEDSIQENFRPFIQVSGGPLFGSLAPYYNDVNNDGVRNQDEQSNDIFSVFTKGSLKMGMDGFIGIGASFGVNRKVQQGLKIGYSFMYFFDDIRLMDIQVQENPSRFFGTPTIALTFGRIR